MASENGQPRSLTEGWRPAERGHVPKKVQGGYQAPTSAHGTPPKGGSSVTSPKK